MRAARFRRGAGGGGGGPGGVIVAGVGSAHEGSGETAQRMSEAAFRMGADAILFEIFRSELLVVRRHPGRRNLDAVELSAKEWRGVLKAAKASGLAVLAEALDHASLELAAEAGVDAHQVHTTDMENPEFIRAVGSLGRPVLLTVGVVPEGVVREACDLVGGPLGLLHGLPTVPAPLEELRFRDLLALKESYRVPVGFLDQTDGGSAFALLAPALAAAHGADLLETPFTLDRTRNGPDYQPSLSPEDFYRMVELRRQAERARGDGAAAQRAGPRRLPRQLPARIRGGGS